MDPHSRMTALLLGGVVLVLLVVAGVALARRRQRRRIEEARRREEEDFDLVFPEGPDDRRARSTVVGRRIKRERA